MSEYIEKKAVTDWLAAKKKEADVLREYYGKISGSWEYNYFSGERRGYGQADDFINSLPTQDVTPSEAKPEVDLEAEIEERAKQVSCCDFCHASEVEDRERWCADQFRYFYNLNPKHK